jgi:hypothetical protein
VLLFVGERAHQWQGLASADWTVSWQGRRVRRAQVVWVALIVAWAEGLGFYVQSERAFWGMIFWVYAAHVALTGVLASRAARGGTRALRAVLALCALAALLVLRAGGPGSWVGEPLVDLPGASAGGPVAGLAVLVLAHAVPCFVDNLRRRPPPARLACAALGVVGAIVEWQIVARSLWFPEGSPFPDLPNWWDPGAHANFAVHPLWMAPFLGHVAIDAVRAACVRRTPA